MTDHELIANLHRRMDSQDKLLLEIDRKITAHMTEEDSIKPALDELVVMWRGSKLLLPIFATLAAMVWGVLTWARDNLK